MLAERIRLPLYLVIGVTLLAILFPPFTIDGGSVEYGFVACGPPSVNAALDQAAFIAGPDRASLAAGLFR